MIFRCQEKYKIRIPEEPTSSFREVPLIRKVITGIAERIVFGVFAKRLFPRMKKNNVSSVE